MNFLAHIHIAKQCDSDIAGNLLGDFVKGNPANIYPQEIVNGIQLHRFVDRFTDTHGLPKQAKSLFQPSRRRYAPIALDLFWDHCLAKEWARYNNESLDTFCRSAEVESQKPHLNLPERYIHVMQRMWRDGWLISYGDLANIEIALERMSRRSPRMAPLAYCIQDIDKHYSEIFPLFEDLYQDVLRESAVFSRTLGKL